MLDLQITTHIPKSSNHYSRPLYYTTDNNIEITAQDPSKNDDPTFMSARSMLASNNTLTRTSQSHRKNTLDRRSASTGPCMLTSSSSTISSVSNNIERDRTARETSSIRTMPNEPRYYVMESDIPDVPPINPTPPEVPPRAHSLYSASSKTSTSIWKKSDYVLKIDKNGDQTHEEYIPPGQQEYLRSSISRSTGYAPGSPTFNSTQHSNRLQPTLQSSQQMTQGMSNTNTGSRLEGSSPLVMPVFPLRTSHSGHMPHYSPYSPSRFHIDKRCQQRCSWRCFSFALIVLSLILTSMLTYFAATSSLKSNIDPTNCIIVQDVKSSSHDQASSDSSSSNNIGALAGTAGSNGGSTLLPTEESLLTSTADHNSFTTSNYYGNNNNMHISLSQFNYQETQKTQEQLMSTLAAQKWPAIVEIKGFNDIHRATIPPFQFWNAEFRNKHPAFIQFNFTLPWGANFAVYGRRNVGPSITQYDFVEFVKGGRIDHRLRRKRSLLNDNIALDDDLNDLPQESSRSGFQSSFEIRRSNEFIFADLHLDQVDQHIISKRSADSSIPKLDMDSMTVNVTILQYLDVGRWFLSVYNDELLPHSITLVVDEAEGIRTTCPNDCSGRGSCYLGKCDCIDGYQGPDCSISVCPVLCSSHGHYGGGVCHCEEGWKGSECDIPVTECELPSCSNHGRCIEGDCHCERGWKGLYCEQPDCIDPSCAGHGTCVSSQCYCKAGWQGEDCSIVDQQVYQCLPTCSDHGTYDLETGSCVCDRHWTGVDCSQALCSLDCGPNGICESGRCRCNSGWTGSLCDQLTCDSRCAEHGQCKNGTCVCSQGWNGRHCTLPGCENGCSRHGQCTLEDGEYRCVCIEGWAGTDCSIALEISCKDNIDNDNDGMTDCSDSECCTHPICTEHIMCLASNDPVEVLLRKQPPSVTASFYQRVKFLIEENSVQSYAHMDEYSESEFWNSFTPCRVSVMRGQVVTPQGLGIIGIRVSVDRDSRFGFTLTRQGGWFDVLVNGGGAVTLQFQRSPFRPLTRTVFVPWNQIVVLPPVQMQLNDEDEQSRLTVKPVPSNPAYSFLSTSQYRFLEDNPSPVVICLEHEHELLKPQLTSTWMPNGVGSMPGKSVIFAETQIVQESIRIPGSNLYLTYQSSQASGYKSIVRMQLTHDKIPETLTHVHIGVQIEGSLHVKTYEADPNLSYIFAWNKRNVYKQKVYGTAVARISIGYQHSTCKDIVWETQTAKLQGFDVDISDIGGWGLDIHHHYNFHEGILQKGDGTTLHLKEYPRIVKQIMGDGQQRPLICKDHCNGLSKHAKLLTPVALTSGPDGSLYVGDFNMVRRITTNGSVFTVLELETTQVAYQYYLSVSPADGHLYISDPEKHRILRVVQLENVPDPSSNSDVVVGSGQRCIPGDEENCGDGGPAKQARLSHPKGITIAADKTMYIADGTNIRAVDPKGIIHTLIGHHGHHNHWSPAPCRGALLATRAQLQWPTGLALNPLDGSLHFIDDRLVLKLTADMKIKVVAGVPLHCNGNDEHNKTTSEDVLGTVVAMDFAPSGDLYIADTDSRRVNSIRVVDSAGNMRSFAGKLENGMQTCECYNGSSNPNTMVNNYSTMTPTTKGPIKYGSNGGLSTTTSMQQNPSVMMMMTGCSCNNYGNFPSGAAKSRKEEVSAPQSETILSSNIKFQAISAIAVAQDGVINIADQGSLRILALQHHLPQHDTNGEFQIPFTPSDEIYVFNRYGQHVATKDLASAKTRYSFLYSKNTSFGKLSTVTDSSGNKIQFLRDYSNVVSSIENTQDHKSELKISSNGMLTRITERKEKSELQFDYDSNSGLLLSRTGNGETFIYQYDEYGRVTKAILPSGEIYNIKTVLSGKNDDLGVQVSESIHSHFAQEQAIPTLYSLTGGIKNAIIAKDSEVVIAKISHINNTLSVSCTDGIVLESSAIAAHPYLEKVMPIEAEMLPMWSHQTVKMGENLVNTMYSKYSFITNEYNRAPQQRFSREIWVNNTQTLRIDYEQLQNREIFMNKYDEIILTVLYDQSGLPVSYYPGSETSSFFPLNITYDRFNRVEGWQWGPAELRYNYDMNGLLAEVTSQQDGIISYSYNELNLLSEISLGSQRKFKLTYDSNGGLRHITLPSGTKHSFSIQPSIGFIRFTYTPPGSNKPYLQHYSYSGALLQTIYPGDGARIVYRYNSANLVSEIVHGDGRSEFTYGTTSSMPSAVVHTERDLEYRWDFDYVGGLLMEERLDFSAKTGLSNAKFSYEYDNNFRLISIQGRIGGQNLQNQMFSYSEQTGSLSQIGQFKLSTPTHNQTILGDGTATFSRTINGRFLETLITVMIHRMTVFRMEFTHDMHGRISQTRTYTRNVGVNTYTNIKNYTWDCDGQLIGVEAQEPWGFRYDDNGNMLSLTYRGNTIPMEYSSTDRIVKFGEGPYKYEVRGLVAQNAREERFHYNTQGLLIRATKRGRFDVRYYYDHLNRLITRKDNFGNVTQFFYNNQERLNEVSQIYSPRDGKLMSLIYDDRGRLIFSQVYRHKYYIATDQCGTPVMMFNQYGEGIREIMRSPYGHIVYDSNPYLYMPIDFCGGILDQVTSLVHMPNGKVYDPLIGQWMTPNWKDVDQRINNPTRLHLYRFNGNDPINREQSQNHPSDNLAWIKLMGYNIHNLVPQANDRIYLQKTPWNQLQISPITEQVNLHSHQPIPVAIESGFLSYLYTRKIKSPKDLTMPPRSALKSNGISIGPFKIGAASDPPFGKGIIVSRTLEGQAIVSSVPAANPIYRDVYTSVFNRTRLIPFTFVVHNSLQDAFFFIKEESWRSGEDRQQLKRLQGQVNTTFHEGSRENGSGNNHLDVKLHIQNAVINLKYGTTVEKERQRLMHHARLQAVRKAWHREKELLRNGLISSYDWTQQETDDIIKNGYANLYEGEYIHDVAQYPEMLEDPFNVRFIKKKTSQSRKRKRRDLSSESGDSSTVNCVDEGKC
ncbi:teneurin-a isoform X3 [Toxorhynchites rutilus septentrionalis]|nr:teneurin-a isoform X3 [Toxorhynchites rutilus septentrionalis]